MKKLIHILYPLYAAVCLAACLGAERVYQWARALVSNTFQTSYIWLEFLPLFLLGTLWAAEHLLAARVGKAVLLVTRLVAVAVLLVWTLYTMYVPLTLPEWFHPIGYAPYVIIWFLLGWLIVSTLALLCRKKGA